MTEGNDFTSKKSPLKEALDKIKEEDKLLMNNIEKTLHKLKNYVDQKKDK